MVKSAVITVDMTSFTGVLGQVINKSMGLKRPDFECIDLSGRQLLFDPSTVVWDQYRDSAGYSHVYSATVQFLNNKLTARHLMAIPIRLNMSQGALDAAEVDIMRQLVTSLNAEADHVVKDGNWIEVTAFGDQYPKFIEQGRLPEPPQPSLVMTPEEKADNERRIEIERKTRLSKITKKPHMERGKVLPLDDTQEELIHDVEEETQYEHEQRPQHQRRKGVGRGQ